MNSKTGQKSNYLIGLVVVSIAVTGYYIGLHSPMNPALKSIQDTDSTSKIVRSIHDRMVKNDDSNAIVATTYSEMHFATEQLACEWRTHLNELKSNIDPTADVIIGPGQKEFALVTRKQNRAFNGAPPTIPHPVDQLSAKACIVCHGEGISTQSLRIPKMSHQLLENCTQCHVEVNSVHTPSSLFRENDFAGLPAPTGGPRAFEGAPPMIPHSTWMRVDCTTCHGFAGLQGIRTTHPWRQNCLQCHAPSSVLDQVQLNATSEFLVPPNIEK